MRRIILLFCILTAIISCEGKQKVESQLSMVMLNNSMAIIEKSLVENLNMNWKDEFKISNFSEKDNTIMFVSDTIQFAISEMLIAIPSEDLDFPIETAWYWNSAEKDIETHTSHLIVFASGEIDKKELSRKLTMLTSSLVELTDSLGVYWGSSSQVIQNELFVDYSRSLKDDNYPIPIWVKFTGYQNEDGTYYLYTIGLKEYGHREFEIEKYKSNMSEGVFFLMDFADYVLINGPIIKNGDTVGGTEEQKIKAVYKKSTLKSDEDVISILF